MITFSTHPSCTVIFHSAAPYRARSNKGAGASHLYSQHKSAALLWQHLSSCPLCLEHNLSHPPTPGRRAELIWHCICLLCPKLLINTQTIHIFGNWILQALLPHVFQSLLKGQRRRSLETSVSRDREKILSLMHSCHSKIKLVSCKGCEKVKVWT